MSPASGGRATGDATGGEGRARTLGFIRYLGYGFGDTANSLTSMVSSFSHIYDTDVHR